MAGEKKRRNRLIGRLRCKRKGNRSTSNSSSNSNSKTAAKASTKTTVTLLPLIVEASSEETQESRGAEDQAEVEIELLLRGQRITTFTAVSSASARIATATGSAMAPRPRDDVVGSDARIPNAMLTTANDGNNKTNHGAQHVPLHDAQEHDTMEVSIENSFSATGLNAPVEVFLHNFRKNGSDVIRNAYLMKQDVRQNSITTALTTSLPEDLFTIVDTELSLLDEYLQRSNLVRSEQGDEVLIDGVLSIFRSLWYTQTRFRNTFLVGLEECVAASNDFLRMTHKVEQVLLQCHHKYPHLAWLDTPLRTSNDKLIKTFDQASMSVLRREANDLITLYGDDSILAAQKASTYVVRKLEESSIPEELFCKEWEDTWTQNQVVVSIIRTFEDFLTDIHNWYDQEYLYHKTIVALVQSTVCFYIKYLVQKADTIRHSHRRRAFRPRQPNGPSTSSATFLSSTRAITRIMYDIEVLRDYFGSIAKESIPLSRAVSSELSILPVILECLWLAVGGVDCGYHSSLEEFIVVIHKRTGGNVNITNKFLSDIWLLASGTTRSAEGEKIIKNAIDDMHTELMMVTERLNYEEARVTSWSGATSRNGDIDSFLLTLQGFLKRHYDDDDQFFQRQAGCGSIWNNVRRPAAACLPSSSSFDDSTISQGSRTCTSKKTPGVLHLSKKGTKDLMQRVQAFQKHLFSGGSE